MMMKVSTLIAFLVALSTADASPTGTVVEVVEATCLYQGKTLLFSVVLLYKSRSSSMKLNQCSQYCRFFFSTSSSFRLLCLLLKAISRKGQRSSLQVVPTSFVKILSSLPMPLKMPLKVFYPPRNRSIQIYDPNTFGLGFFAAIAIATSDVTLDLNGKTIQQSDGHALFQRFFAVIELADAPFIEGAGPAQFVAKATTFQAASNIKILGPGTIGQSSHHGEYKQP
mmetsp:Transcript_10323/g.24778  ORF Transcript_10323/g.24778 Transcript_10323/m.24778 type:complete len:225 (-) Transcript_10323:995-1669(-)